MQTSRNWVRFFSFCGVSPPLTQHIGSKQGRTLLGSIVSRTITFSHGLLGFGTCTVFHTSLRALTSILTQTDISVRSILLVNLLRKFATASALPPRQNAQNVRTTPQVAFPNLEIHQLRTLSCAHHPSNKLSLLTAELLSCFCRPEVKAPVSPQLLNTHQLRPYLSI